MSMQATSSDERDKTSVVHPQTNLLKHLDDGRTRYHAWYRRQVAKAGGVVEAPPLNTDVTQLLFQSGMHHFVGLRVFTA